MDAGWAECPGRSTGRCAQSEPPKNGPALIPRAPLRGTRNTRRSLVDQSFGSPILAFLRALAVSKVVSNVFLEMNRSHHSGLRKQA